MLRPGSRSPLDHIMHFNMIVDYLTKWAEAYAMPYQTSENMAKILVNEFICRFGIPSQIHSDQGSQFEAALFQQMCQLLGMRKTRTTAFHPQSDGQTERQNRTVIDVLAKLARENPCNGTNSCVMPQLLIAVRCIP